MTSKCQTGCSGLEEGRPAHRKPMRKWALHTQMLTQKRVLDLQQGNHAYAGGRDSDCNHVSVELKDNKGPIRGQPALLLAGPRR